jgi:hypothetical protein
MYGYNSFHINSTEGSGLVNKLCEAVDCSVEATEQIEVSAGKYGPISLFVCVNCKKFFEELEIK